MPSLQRDRAARTAWVLTTFALLAPIGCGTTEVFGWVWANQTIAASYTPDATHQYNTSGGASSVTRSGTGVYQVTFAGLGGVHGGNVQVTARGSDSARCKVSGWQTTGSTVTAGVRCFQGPTPADSEFLASYEATNHADSAVAYAHYDPPATPTVTAIPDLARAWNVTGIYTPIHSVLLAGAVTGFAMENVTADGAGPEFCGFGVNRVTCWDASGAAVDTPFSYVKGLGRVPTSRRGAYAVYDIAPGDTYPPFTPQTQQSSFSTASLIVITRLSVGLYAVLIPGAASASAGGSVLVQVTALDLGAVGGPVNCKPVTWNNASADVVVQVACFMTTNGLDTPTEDGFQMSYIVAP
jgi:hypothetical protein